MKHLKTYKIFESQKYSMGDFMNVIHDLRDKCFEFSDNGCNWKLLPEDEIQLNLLRLAYNGTIESKGIVFKLVIDVRLQPYQLTVPAKVLPNWFIDLCREIESMMKMYGFKTLPSIHRSFEYEHFDTIDELSEANGIFSHVILLFNKIG